MNMLATTVIPTADVNVNEYVFSYTASCDGTVECDTCLAWTALLLSYNIKRMWLFGVIIIRKGVSLL